MLRLLGRSETPIGVHAIARELGLVPSTCLHVLRALVAEELVAFDTDTKRYSLDAGVLTLARHWLRRNRFTDIAQPALDEIAETFGITALGVRVVGIDHIIVVALSQSSHSLQLSTQIGSRFPALISATGRCVAAFGNHPPAEIEKRFRALRWDDAPSWSTWSKEVETVRRQGYSIDRNTYIAGVTIVSVPVLDASGTMARGIASVGISDQLDRARSIALAHDMQAAARSIAS